MSGLFLRLARQAVGQVRNPVRAALPPRFQADPSTTQPEPVAAQSGARTDTPTDTPTANLQTAAESLQAYGHDTVPELAANARARDSSVATAPQTQPRERAQPLERERVDPPPVVNPQEEPAAPRQTAQRIVQARDPVASVVADEAAGSHADQPLDNDQSLAAATTSEDFILATPPETTAPEPLLASPVTTSAFDPLTGEQSSAVEMAAPNEVHVHIGRIEVTALAPAAAPQARRPAARQPMSLDDYLARRRQGST